VFVPAALLAAELAEDSGKHGAGVMFIMALRRLPTMCWLAVVLLAGWPWELARRALKLKPSSWRAQEGAPLAGLLAAVLVAKDGVGAREALRRAPAAFGSSADHPGASLFGRPLFQPQVVTALLAAPALFTLSVLPARLAHFSPARMFGLWFLSDGLFAVGFGVWAAALLSCAALGVLLSIGGVHASHRRRHES
jgi:hypothetical protein